MRAKWWRNGTLCWSRRTCPRGCRSGNSAPQRARRGTHTKVVPSLPACQASPWGTTMVVMVSEHSVSVACVPVPPPLLEGTKPPNVIHMPAKVAHRLQVDSQLSEPARLDSKIYSTIVTITVICQLKCHSRFSFQEISRDPQKLFMWPEPRVSMLPVHGNQKKRRLLFSLPRH